MEFKKNSHCNILVNNFSLEDMLFGYLFLFIFYTNVQGQNVLVSNIYTIKCRISNSSLDLTFVMPMIRNRDNCDWNVL